MVTGYVDRPQSLSSHAFCGSVSQSSAFPKKDAASWGPHSGTFPSDPSLKASTAAEEIRDSHRLSLNSITTGEDRSGSDWSGLLTGPSMSKHLHPARILNF